MNEDLSSSMDEFTDDSDEVLINEESLDSAVDETDKPNSSIDSRRRLEALLADRQLEKDIQEFNFDL